MDFFNISLIFKGLDTSLFCVDLFITKPPKLSIDLRHSFSKVIRSSGGFGLREARPAACAPSHVSENPLLA